MHLFWGTKIRETRAKDEADKWGLKGRRKAKEREKKEGELESNLQVRLLGLLPLSLHCPLLYLSTCSVSPPSSALPLFSLECHRQ